MARLTEEQARILKLIAKGKYIFPETTYDIRTEAWQNIIKLTKEKLIDYDLNSDGGAYYNNFTLTDEGIVEIEERERAEKEESKKDTRWRVTTVISILALIISILALINSILARLGV